MKRHGIGLVLIVQMTATVWIGALGFGQSNAQFQSPESWRETHRLKNRYEGLLASPTAANPEVLTVLSFTGAMVPFSGKEEWRVRFYSPTMAQVIVSARDVNDAFQYWMESFVQRAASGWSTFAGWDTSDVLVRRGIPASIVGVIVSLNGDLHNLAPAFVFPSTQPLKVSLLVDTYDLRMRSGVRLDRVAYELTGIRDGRRSEGAIAVNEPGDSAFLLRLNARTLADGPVSAKVRGFRNGTQVASGDFSFFHQKTLPDATK